MRVAGFGEIMLRLSTDKGIRILNSNDFKVNYGGGEANVLISLSKLGMDTRFITMVSNDDIGDAIIGYLNSKRVDTTFISRSNKRTGIYFLEVGSGNRPSKVIYDRADSAFSNMKVEDLDIELALDGVDVFHFSGITLALSEEIRTLTMKILKHCKKNNIMVSYDSNYRAKLWSLEEASKATLEILPYIDILSAGILDAENILNMSCKYKDKYDKLNYYYSEIINTYPNIKHIFSSIRENISVSVNTLQCNYYSKNRLYPSKIYTIDDIVDRVGGGDALTAGILYGILKEKAPEYIAEFATSASVLKHSIQGDANLVSVDEVESLMNNGVGKISR
ncbi:sugar kinase [Romboutsia weinsteinii]|uniref:Sugar kinase n=1 Tax=Romboutsia weinsteinii TaxID=2020949 RepID=A0A371J123_9FIRM|nr:sugar kinase [Romboutsia weinsteinii]RDY26479.1 sugar kinase [Romboutsia weinsteinii]